MSTDPLSMSDSAEHQLTRAWHQPYSMVRRPTIAFGGPLTGHKDLAFRIILRGIEASFRKG
jgi:hypothetical protein